MYLRPVFEEHDLALIQGLIEANPFGLLVTHGPGLDASHVPFTIERSATGWHLAAHLAAANAQCALLEGHAALAIFSGPHAYIAPGWYRSAPAVPTWDYAAVHVHGRLEAVTDEGAIVHSLQSLAEADPREFRVDGLPDGFRARMIAGIRAFRLYPERIEAQWKMSQNRSVVDREAVVQALRARGEDAVAGLIEATIGDQRMGLSNTA